MSRARHAKGGSVKPVKAGGNPEVFAEAASRKKGGKVIGKDAGDKAKRHMGKPGRKAGGRVGANTSPLSTAHNTSSPSKAAD